MRKLFYLLAFALVTFFSNTASSQDLLQNAFFLEVGGISPQYSINYEKIFAQNKSVAIATRMGFSINRTFLAVPVGITLITVPGMHHVQVTVGVTPQIEDYNSLSIQGSDTYLYIDSGVGYRFEKRRFPLFWIRRC